MRKSPLLRYSVLLLLILVTAGIAFGQVSLRQAEALKDSSFSISGSEYLYSDGPEGGGKTLVISVHAVDSGAIEEDFVRFSKRLKAEFSNESGLLVIFFADRISINDLTPISGAQDEDDLLKKIRGIYTTNFARVPTKEVFRHFPRGITASDMDKFLSEQRN